MAWTLQLGCITGPRSSATQGWWPPPVTGELPRSSTAMAKPAWIPLPRSGQLGMTAGLPTEAQSN